ncbi:MAG: glycosyltransferase family 2 protein [Anaerolineae bacterium]|nr:glycosyltransferase family 2 protein [Anaerolineae bacterium]
MDASTADHDPLVSIVVPAYNEHGAIAGVLGDIVRVMDATALSYEIIVVDDGSTDETCSICEAFSSVRLVRHDRNRGTGAARTTGVCQARGLYVVMTDADGTYPIDAIPRLLDELARCDMVIGARDREMGTVRWLRSLAKEIIRALASYLTSTKIPDLNSGLRAMRRELVLRFLPILPTTHSWVSTITMAFLSSDLSVHWIPISYHRRIGRSTFHPIRDTYNYLSLVVRAIMYFNPLRVFLPLSTSLLAIGFGKAIYDIFAYNFHFAPSTVMLVLTAIQLGAIGLLADLIVRRGKL